MLLLLLLLLMLLALLLHSFQGRGARLDAQSLDELFEYAQELRAVAFLSSTIELVHEALH